MREKNSMLYLEHNPTNSIITRSLKFFPLRCVPISNVDGFEVICYVSWPLREGGKRKKEKDIYIYI